MRRIENHFANFEGFIGEGCRCWVLSLASEGSEKEDEDQKVRHSGRVGPVKNKIQIEDRRRGNLIHVF